LEHIAAVTCKIEIFTATGSPVSAGCSTHETFIEVNMQQHPAGVYFVKVNGQRFFKIIKAR
jgi:hypothetical protein